MAAPTVRGVGAETGVGTTSCVVPVPTGGSAPVSGDVMIIVHESSDSSTAAGTPNTPGGWSQLHQSSQLVGSTGTTTTTIFGKMAAGGDADVTVDGVLNHCVGVMIVIAGHGCSVIGDVQVGTAQGADTGTTALPIAGITTTNTNSLILMCVGSGRDSTADSLSAYTNANLSSITEQFDLFTNTAAGGGVGCATGIKASIGSTGDSTFDQAASVPYRCLHLEVKSSESAPTTQIDDPIMRGGVIVRKR